MLSIPPATTTLFYPKEISYAPYMIDFNPELHTLLIVVAQTYSPSPILRNLNSVNKITCFYACLSCRILP